MDSHAYSVAAGLPTDALASAFLSRIGTDLLPVSEVATRLDRTPERVGQMIRADLIPAIHVSLNGRGAYLVCASDLARWCDSEKASVVV